MSKKRVFSSLLALVMCISASITAFAADDHIANYSGSTGTSDVSLTIEVPTFSVTVPTQLPVSISADGTVSCADSGSAKIINNGYAPIYVSNIAINPQGAWNIIAYDADFDVALATPGTKEIGFKLNNVSTVAGGSLNGYAEADWAISGYAASANTDELALTYDACLPIQIVSNQETTVAAQVVFTVAWDTAGYYQ